MKSHFDELKHSIEKVRTRNSEDTVTTSDSMMKSNSVLESQRSSSSTSGSDSDDRQPEDIKKLEQLIKQLSDRWSAAFQLFKSRRSDLKKCLQAYEEYKQSLNAEKKQLTTMMEAIPSDSSKLTTAEQQAKNLNTRKASIDSCVQKATEFLDTAKVLIRARQRSFKVYLKISDLFPTLSSSESPFVALFLGASFCPILEILGPTLSQTHSVPKSGSPSRILSA